MRRTRRIIISSLVGLMLLCLAATLLSALSNLTLPKGPVVLDRLAPLDKARLQETLHLKQTLGEAIWPGWGQADIPVVLWNREYAFLIGYDAPPPDWAVVPGDTLDAQPYYRQPSDDPQNFAVRVGDRWAASLATKWETDTFLREQFHKTFPPIVRDVFPYRLLIQPSEVQMTGVLHESFHVYQALAAPQRFEEANKAYRDDSPYWAADAAMHEAWKAEIDLLFRAVQAKTDDEATDLAHQFLAQRDARRAEHNLTPNLVNYERQIEWLEGLAKYVELTSWRVATLTPDYTPLPLLNDDADFKDYRTFEQRWSQELDQMKRQAAWEGDIRFYYTGMAQAIVLDRLMPDWKARILTETTGLEDLLREAAQ
jgi:hypothetical protein